MMLKGLRNFAATFFVALLLASATAGIAAPASDVEVIAKVPILKPENADNSGGNGSMIVDPQRRRGYMIFPTTNIRTTIKVYNLDTFELIAAKEFPFRPISPLTAGGSGEYVHAFDQDSGFLYFAYEQGGSFSGILQIDGPSLTLRKQFAKADAPADPGAQGLCTSVNSCVPMPVGVLPTIRGLDVTPARLTGSNPKLLLLMQEPKPPGAESNFNIVWTAQWDTESGQQDWIYRVGACGNYNLPSHTLSRYKMGLFQSRRGAAIYVACQGSGGTGQVVRLLTGDGGRPLVEEVFPGPLSVADNFVDAESDRVLMRVLNEEGESWWVFDGTSNSYVGVIGATLSPVASTAGLDSQNGRLYIVAPPSGGGRQKSEGGLLVSDIRRSPVPQAISFPQFASSGRVAIAVDSGNEDRPTRVFVRHGDDAFYTVYQDNLPVSVDPPLAEQDRFTAGVEEAPGVAASNFTGTGHAYGLRSLIVGGLDGVPPGGPNITGVRPGRYGPAAAGTLCSKSDREIVFASVKQAALSNNLAGAAAISMDADPGTKTDFEEIVSRCWARPRQPGTSGADPLANQWPRPDVDRNGDGKNDLDALVGQPWFTTSAECSNDGKDSSDTRNLSGYDASVVCEQSASPAKVIGQSRATNIELAGIKVGESLSSVTLIKDPKRGLVVHSEAWVRGVDIEGVVKFDVAGVVAEAFAAGRTGTAGTTFKRVLCGIEIPEAEISEDACIIEDNAATPTIEGQLGKNPIETQINRALSGRGQISFPNPDSVLVQGSPGGYIASVQKDRAKEVSSRAINNDASTQVPAIEFIVFNDDPTLGRGRQIYQFAGVDASTTYGIYLLSALGLDDIDIAAPDFEFPEIPLSDFIAETVYGPLPDVPAPVVKASGPLGNAIKQAAKAFGYGIGFMVNNPGDALLAMFMWGLLAAPVYLAIRRRTYLGAVK